MKLKLFRWGNFFNPSFVKSLAVLIFILSFFSCLNHFRWDFIISALLVILLFIFLFPTNYPRYIELTENQIHYIKPTVISRSQRGKGYRGVKVHYRVINIVKCELHQSSIERLFGIAHIRFEGETIIDAGKFTDKISNKDNHCIYGIVLKKHKDIIETFIQKR